MGGNGTVDVIVETDWERKLPKTNKVSSFTTKTPLSSAKMKEIGGMLRKVYQSKTSIEASFTVNNAVNDIIHLPGSSPAAALGTEKHNLLFTFHRQQSKYNSEWTQWWSAKFIAVKQKPSKIEVVAASDQ